MLDELGSTSSGRAKETDRRKDSWCIAWGPAFVYERSSHRYCNEWQNQQTIAESHLTIWFWFSSVVSRVRAVEQCAWVCRWFIWRNTFCDNWFFRRKLLRSICVFFAAGAFCKITSVIVRNLWSRAADSTTRVHGRHVSFTEAVSTLMCQLPSTSLCCWKSCKLSRGKTAFVWTRKISRSLVILHCWPKWEGLSRPVT